jgi:hypothetical protein
MALQFSVAVRNARADVLESTVGTLPILRIFTGSPPANCAAADSGTLLAEMTLPSDWMAAASSGSKAKSGTWQDASANNSGNAGHFRIYDSTGATCHHQGTCSASGGGGDMILAPSVVLTAGQSFTVNTYTINEANA